MFLWLCVSFSCIEDLNVESFASYDLVLRLPFEYEVIGRFLFLVKTLKFVRAPLKV